MQHKFECVLISQIHTIVLRNLQSISRNCYSDLCIRGYFFEMNVLRCLAQIETKSPQHWGLIFAGASKRLKEALEAPCKNKLQGEDL